VGDVFRGDSVRMTTAPSPKNSRRGNAISVKASPLP
jgi:hypothetical protein